MLFVALLWTVPSWRFAAETVTTSPGGYVSVGLVSAAVSGLVVVLTGRIVVPTFAYNREKERADKWEAEAMRLNAMVAEKHVPALDSAAHAVAESSEVLKRALDALARRRST